MKRIDYCRRLLEESSDEALPAEGISKENMRTGSFSAVSGVFSYKKEVLAVPWKQVTMG